MNGSDRRPPSDTPVTNRIVRSHNNRIGAVYSSLYSFWSARHNAINGTGNRRDAYSVILFDSTSNAPVTNDFTSTPDELLNLLLPHGARGGTSYDLALREAQTCMNDNWSTERYVFATKSSASDGLIRRRSPVIIFLSDGLCGVQESNVRDLCRRSIALGCVCLPLNGWFALTRRVVVLCPSTPSHLVHTMKFCVGWPKSLWTCSGQHPRIPCAQPFPRPTWKHSTRFVAALVSSIHGLTNSSLHLQVRLAETFLGIADSLAKPRGALMHA